MFLEVVYVLRMIGWIKDFFKMNVNSEITGHNNLRWSGCEMSEFKCCTIKQVSHVFNVHVRNIFFLPWWGSKVTGIQGHQNEYLKLGNSFIWIQQYCKATELVLYLRKKYSCDENKHAWLGCFDLQVIEIDRASLISRFYSCFKFN